MNNRSELSFMSLLNQKSNMRLTEMSNTNVVVLLITTCLGGRLENNLT